MRDCFRWKELDILNVVRKFLVGFSFREGKGRRKEGRYSFENRWGNVIMGRVFGNYFRCFWRSMDGS